MLRIALLALCAAALPAAVFAADWSAESGKRDTETGIRVPAGFTATVFADGLGPVRHLAVRENGVVYAALRRPANGGGIVALRDTDGDGAADRSEYFGDRGGTGIALRGDYLYFGADTEVMRYRLGAGLQPAGEAETIVAGFPDQGQHAAKPVAFDGEGGLYVGIGAPSNACQKQTRTPGSEGQRPCPQLERQAGIWRYAADTRDQVHGERGERYLTGTRHPLALDWHRGAGALYFVSHGRDQLHEFFPRYYSEQDNAELPAEEFHRAEAGADYGWPYTYWDPLKNRRMVAPEYGGDGEREAESGKYPDPLVAFPAHWAPNDLVFYTGESFPEYFRHGAFVVFHGSWNRAPLPQQGYNVAFVPMNTAGEVIGDWIVFADGFKGEEKLRSSSEAAHRPTGLAVGPDGALYISDDEQGRIWKVSYRGR